MSSNADSFANTDAHSDSDPFANALSLSIIHAIADAQSYAYAHGLPHESTSDCDPDASPYCDPASELPEQLVLWH